MNEEKQPMEYGQVPADSTYQTGSTRPPKSHVGVVSLLLGLVIFFCGISTILSLLRINLLQAISTHTQSKNCALAFAETEPEAPKRSDTALGFQGQTVSLFWQRYHRLPEGVYVTQVCNSQVLRSGDILLQLGSDPVCDWDRMQELLGAYAPGQTVTVTVYRNGQTQQLRLTICE